MLAGESEHNVHTPLSIINVFINNCFELGGYGAATERVLSVSAARLGNGEGECRGLGPNADFFRDVLIAIIGGVGPVDGTRVSTTLELRLEDIPIKNGLSVVFLVFL